MLCMDEEVTSEDTHVFAAVMQHISTYLRRRRLIHSGDEEGAQALRALESYDQGDVAMVAQQMMTHEIPELRCQGAEMLLRLDAQSNLSLILPLLKDTVMGVRAEICGLLHDLGDHRAVEIVAHLVRYDPEPTVRHIAAYTLERIGDERAIEALEWVAEHDIGTDWEGRPIAWQANAALKAIRERKVVERGEA